MVASLATQLDLRHTVFDLISGLFAYVIFGQKKRPNINKRTPLNFFFFGKYCQRALCNFLYLVCVYPGCKTVREGRKSLFWQVYIILQDDRYNTILSALETITKTAMRSLS